jgi:hypothetical protein
MQVSGRSLQTTWMSKGLEDRVLEEIERLKEANPEFLEAHETYVLQYGKSKININSPTNLGSSIDPVVLVLGRNCVVTYVP